MTILALLADRPMRLALPAAADLHLDLKHEHLSVSSLDHVAAIEPAAIFVDGGENPGQAWAVLRELESRGVRAPVLLIVERDDLERYPWSEIVDEFVYPGAPTGELRTRLAMLRRRAGVSGDATIHLGPLSLDTDRYRVTASGRALDLTYKEFELLRFLASHPGRVFTRPALLREVWGYDFYGGTRTVDVHVRRLRAKLGPEHEQLIQTVRSVGYRAAELQG
jgi:DNA-binding response OmpR family regulator